ncbi:MAG: HYR domain-containing protein [Acidobacteriota bacterium]
MRSSTVRITLASILTLAIASVISWTALDASSNRSSTATTAFSAQDIGSARAALGQAMAEQTARAKNGKSLEVSEAFRAYKAAIDQRKAEIYERLKQLDILIADPPADSAIDDPARSPYLNPRPEMSAFVAEYDPYRAELSALVQDFNSVKAQVNLSLGIQAAVCPPSTTINGTLGSGSQDSPATSGQQTGRILNGLGNFNCGSSNPCTLNTTTGLRTFDAYTFTNPGSSTACVTVDWTMTGCSLAQAMQFSARVGSFDPANPCANYVGDAGAGFSGEADGTFSFNVPAGQTFVVVVNTNEPDGDPASAVGCAYSLTISGIDCSNQPCAIFCPSDITQLNDPGECGAIVTFSPTTTGDCGAVTCTPASGSFFPPGTTTVNCSAASGQSCSFTVTVQTPPPTITCPANITAVAPPSCNQSAGVVVNYPAPTALDVCGSITPVCSPPSGSSFPVGTTTVTCTATGAGGTSACSFTVTAFSGCLRDDSNSGNVVLFNTATGDYRFCCGGVVIASGKGTVSRRGCEFTIQHNTADRRVLIKVNFATGKGTASIQSPPGITKCSITDRNLFDNSCQCGG